MSREQSSPGADSVANENADMPFVSVIIPVYNDVAGLKTCLRALHGQTYPPDRFEIIVVDNGSDEDLSDIMNQHPGVRLLREPKPGSYAARNKAIVESKAAVLAFTDSDCDAAPVWLEAGVSALSQPECQGVVGGRVDFTFRKPDSPTTAELYDSVTYFNQEKYIHERGFTGTGNLFSRRDIFEKVGLFNEALKSGGDREWGQRCSDLGIRPLYASDACVKHPARDSFVALVKKAQRVAGGLHEISSSANTTPAGRIARMGKRLLGPARRTVQLWRHPRLTRLADRARVIALSWILDVAALAEALTIMITGATRRS